LFGEERSRNREERERERGGHSYRLALEVLAVEIDLGVDEESHNIKFVILGGHVKKRATLLIDAVQRDPLMMMKSETPLQIG